MVVAGNCYAGLWAAIAVRWNYRPLFSPMKNKGRVMGKELSTRYNESMNLAIAIIGLVALTWAVWPRKCSCGGSFVAWDERKAFCERCGKPE